MKNRKMSAWKIALISIALGLVLFGIGVAISMAGGEWGFGANYVNIEEKQEIDLSTAHSLDIGCTYADIDIVSSQNGPCEIKYSRNIPETLAGKLKLEVADEKGSVRIKENVLPGAGFLPGGGVKLEISIPMSFKGKFSCSSASGHILFNTDANSPGVNEYETAKISSVSGEVSIAKIKAKDIEIDNASGKITLDGMASVNLFVSNASGGIVISGTNSEEVFIKSVSGSIEATSSSFRHAKMESTSGGIALRSVSEMQDETKSGRNGFMKLNTASGSVNVEYYSKSAELNIKTVSGGVQLTLPADSQNNIKFDSVSGKINSEFDIDNKGRVVRINTVSGSAELIKAK